MCYKTTVDGTVCKSKPQPLPEITNIKGQPCSIFFAFGRQLSKGNLVSYITNNKTRKKVVVVSTMHSDGIYETTEEACKPHIIIHYNNT